MSAWGCSRSPPPGSRPWRCPFLVRGEGVETDDGRGDRRDGDRAPGRLCRLAHRTAPPPAPCSYPHAPDSRCQVARARARSSGSRARLRSLTPAEIIGWSLFVGMLATMVLFATMVGQALAGVLNGGEWRLTLAAYRRRRHRVAGSADGVSRRRVLRRGIHGCAAAVAGRLRLLAARTRIEDLPAVHGGSRSRAAGRSAAGQPGGDARHAGAEHDAVLSARSSASVVARTASSSRSAPERPVIRRRVAARCSWR